MLEGQFYLRLILQIMVGLIFVKTFMEMAKRDSIDMDKNHLLLKIIGGIFAFLGVLMGIIGVYDITQIRFPYEMMGPILNDDTIFRPSSQTMYWGYPNTAQSNCLTMISNVFVFLALSAYCFLYKSSKSKWHVKVGKVIYCIAFCMFYASSTNFHYFDIYEWIAPVLFGFMAFYVLKNKTVSEDLYSASHVSETDSIPNKNEIESEYMPKNNQGNTIQEDTPNNLDAVPVDLYRNDRSSNEENVKMDFSDSNDFEIQHDNEKIETKVTIDYLPEIKFCTHCGAKVDYIRGSFCKHCGKRL